MDAGTEPALTIFFFFNSLFVSHPGFSRAGLVFPAPGLEPIFGWKCISDDPRLLSIFAIYRYLVGNPIISSVPFDCVISSYHW